MLLIPLDWNLCPAGTIQDSSDTASTGWPHANLFTQDFGKPWMSRGTFDVTAGKSWIDIDEGGGELSGQMTVATYRSASEVCAEAARVLVAAGADDYAVFPLQGSTDPNRIKVQNLTTGGTTSLLIKTGTHGSDGTDASFFRHLGGYRDADRAIAASHVGDFAAIHSSASVLVDLGSAMTIEAVLLINPLLSQGAAITVKLGSTTAVSDASHVFTDYHDDRLMVLRLSSPESYRYLQWHIDDRRSEGTEVGAGFAYAGPVWDSDPATYGHDGVEYEAMSRAHSLQARHSQTETLKAHPVISERRPGQGLTVSLGANPGVAPGPAQALLDIFTEVGTEGILVVVLDPTNDPHGSSLVCRFAREPSLVTRGVQSKHGRVAIDFSFSEVKGWI